MKKKNPDVNSVFSFSNHKHLIFDIFTFRYIKYPKCGMKCK
jgi:hypothetical protein